MKKSGLFLSLFCFLLTNFANAATNGNNQTNVPIPQTYFLSDPAPTTQPATPPEYPSRINTTGQPYGNTNLQNLEYDQSLSNPAYSPLPTPANSYTEFNNQYSTPTLAPTYNKINVPMVPPIGTLQNRTAIQNSQKNTALSNAQGCYPSYEAYRYTGQGLQDSDQCCEKEPDDEECGDSYSLFCHYRPCYYYTTECQYVPHYIYLKCCRYVPQFYNETRCRKVPEYYKVLKQKTVQEAFCVMKCCLISKYNEETCCNETCPMNYLETCYREVPQCYEETCCREVPQYYEETCCRHVPQYYYTCQVKYCPQYKHKRQCKYLPQYYYKHLTNRNPIEMEGPFCSETP